MVCNAFRMYNVGGGGNRFPIPATIHTLLDTSMHWLPVLYEATSHLQNSGKKVSDIVKIVLL